MGDIDLYVFEYAVRDGESRIRHLELPGTLIGNGEFISDEEMKALPTLDHVREAFWERRRKDDDLVVRSPLPDPPDIPSIDLMKEMEDYTVSQLEGSYKVEDNPFRYSWFYDRLLEKLNKEEIIPDETNSKQPNNTKIMDNSEDKIHYALKFCASIHKMSNDMLLTIRREIDLELEDRGLRDETLGMSLTDYEESMEKICKETPTTPEKGQDDQTRTFRPKWNTSGPLNEAVEKYIEELRRPKFFDPEESPI